MIDLDSLTPIDAEIRVSQVSASHDSYIYGDETKEEAEFQQLARLAFDVMMRRGWHVILHHNGQWHAAKDDKFNDLIVPVVPGSPLITHPDPFTALVEADHWMKKEEAKK